MAQSLIFRLADSTFATAFLCLRQAIRQQWFLLIFIPFLVIVIIAPFLPATSETAAYQLMLRAILGAGSAILFIGIVLTSSTSFPAEIRGRTAHRSIISPGGRLTVLTGRIAAFSILSAFVCAAGFISTLCIFCLRGRGSAEFTSASRQYHTAQAAVHKISGKDGKHQGVFWIRDERPAVSWIFPAHLWPAGRTLKLKVTPVVASVVETQAMLTLSAENPESFSKSVKIKLFDNCPTNVEFEEFPGRGERFTVTIMRLPDSSPFGFDVSKDELGAEKNGVLLLTGTRTFTLNLVAAWFVIWIKLCFISSVAVFASTFLSGPIAGAFSLVLYLLGNALGFLSDFAGSLGLPGHVHAHIEQVPHELSLLEKIIKVFVTLFARVYPDLARFDASEALIWGRAMPFDFLLHSIAYFFVYCAILWLASLLILHRRQF